MAEAFEIIGSDGSTFDLLPNIRGSRDLGKPGWTADGWQKYINYERTSDADRTERTIKFTYLLKGDSVDAMVATYQTLMALVMQPTFRIRSNNGGATEPDKYLDCYGCVAVPELPQNLDNATWLEWPLQFSITAKPFMHTDAVQLARNYVIDSGMCEDFNADGVCNSFEPDNSGTAASGLTSMSMEGSQMMTVVAGAAGRYRGVKQQLAIPTSGACCLYAEVRASAVAAGATYDVYFENVTDGQLLNASAVATDGWQKVYLLNKTRTGTVTLRARVNAPDAGSTGTLEVRNAMAVEGAAFSLMGADGAPVYCGSEVSTSPIHISINNLPGHADAAVEMKHALLADTDVPSTYRLGRAAADNEPIDSLTGSWKGFIYKFTGASSASAVGGVCSEVIAHGSEKAIRVGQMHGRFLAVGRIMSDSTDDVFNLKIYPNADHTGTAYPTASLPAIGTANMWMEQVFGVIDLPLGSVSDNDAPANSVSVKSTGGTGTGWQIDNLAFLPLDGGMNRIDALTLLYGRELPAVIYDSVSRQSGLYSERRQSGSTKAFSSNEYTPYYANYADYSTNRVSADMPNIPAGSTFGSFSPGTVSYINTVGTVRRFQLPGSTMITFSAVATFPTAAPLPFHVTGDPEKSNLTTANLDGVIMLPAAVDNLMVAMQHVLTGSGAVQYTPRPAVLSFSVVCRYLA